MSRKHIIDAVDKSVARLGTYIDVLQIHRLDRDTPREEIMRALNDVVESGKVRYIGASSVSIVPADRFHALLTRNRWLLGSSRLFKILLTRMAGISLSPCKTTTISCTARKARYPHSILVFDINMN